MPPQSTSEKPHKHTRRLSDIRGPEEVHNSLIYRQFALQALDGGNLKFGHFEMMRLQVGCEENASEISYMCMYASLLLTSVISRSFHSTVKRRLIRCSRYQCFLLELYLLKSHVTLTLSDNWHQSSSTDYLSQRVKAGVKVTDEPGSACITI